MIYHENQQHHNCETNFDEQETLDCLLELAKNSGNANMLNDYLYKKLKLEGIKNIKTDKLENKRNEILEKIPKLIIELIKNKYGEEAVEAIATMEVKGTEIQNEKNIKLLVTIEYEENNLQKKYSVEYKRVHSKNNELTIKLKQRIISIEIPMDYLKI